MQADSTSSPHTSNELTKLGPDAKELVIPSSSAPTRDPMVNEGLFEP